MSQQEAYDLFKNNKKWFTTKEVATALGINNTSANNNIKKLRCCGFVVDRLKERNKVEYILKEYSMDIK